MNLGKSKIVLQGEFRNEEELDSLEGFEVATSVRHLGILLGQATVAEQYAAPLRKFQQKMAFLRILPLSEKERAFAILTWASLVCSLVVKVVVYPTIEIRWKLDEEARAVMNIKTWSMATQILKQDSKQGGINLCTPSLYLAHLHSNRYVQYISNPNAVLYDRMDCISAVEATWAGDGDSKTVI